MHDAPRQEHLSRWSFDSQSPHHLLCILSTIFSIFAASLPCNRMQSHTSEREHNFFCKFTIDVGHLKFSYIVWKHMNIWLLFGSHLFHEHNSDPHDRKLKNVQKVETARLVYFWIGWFGVCFMQVKNRLKKWTKSVSGKPNPY